ncbi:hypothetical protein [Streptococcus sp. 20-1249]|uniref:hypothetical protein n=1 Tax=Streptococcus hepaticus TaxID=3349163 RepID=UPI0037478D61
MTQEQINQALRLTINELSTKLADESTTKNVLAVQLSEAQQEITNLKAQVDELTALLNEQTQPEIIEGE